MRRLLVTCLAALALAATAGAAGLPGQRTGKAPWPPEYAHLTARLKALGLPPLPQEYFNLHIHQHLDIFVNGKPVAVPPAIGINLTAQYISPLHTHDASGVIHIESPTVQTFTLGQFMGVWGVRFDARCLGGYCVTRTKKLTVYANGKRVSGLAALQPLTQHEEISIVYGKPPRTIPKSYRFAAGL